MSDPRHASKRNLKIGKIALRILTFFAVAYSIGFLLTVSNRYLERENRPAGFTRGLLNGAMMPAAMPNLIMGKDIAIYATNNNGLPYKLGYTMGVNVCGAIFFGIFFLRVNRWKKARAQMQEASSTVS